jgi:hypothetical protein
VEDPELEHDDHGDREPFDPGALMHALRDLVLLGDDPYLSMQVTNIGVIDNWLTELERSLMQEYAQGEGTPLASAVFLSAQSQMWMFAVYELLRTWRERAKDAIKLADSRETAAYCNRYADPHFDARALKITTCG